MKIFSTQSVYLLSKKITYLVSFFVVFAAGLEVTPAAPTAAENADWTILVYVQARNNLSSFSGRNFSDMAAVGSTKNLNLLVQWYKPEDQGVWRYKIEKNQLNLDAHLPSPSDGNSAQDLVEAMRWAVKKYPAKKYCLILWNHGVGILDPIWGNSSVQINKKYLINNPKIQIAGITTEDTGYEFDETMMLMAENNVNKGILFNEQSKTYMNNQVLAAALKQIKNEVLDGKKIDIIGMDACLMGMIEVAYQIKDCADFMVTSQEVELAYGWNYLGWLQDLSVKIISPAHVAKAIVQSYESMYKSKIPFYTQSAVDLNKVEQLKKAVDDVSINMMTCYAVDGLSFSQVVKRARQSCQQFSSVSYVDLHSFMKELSREVKAFYKFDENLSTDLIVAINMLNGSLDLGVKNVEDIVISNVAGKHMTQARGVSIYFPRYMIDPSYERTSFAQDGMWTDLLKHVLINRNHYLSLMGDGVVTP